MSTQAEATPIPTRWRLRKYFGPDLEDLVKRAGLRPALVKSLMALGIDSAEGIREFLSPGFSSWSEAKSFAELEAGADWLYRKIIEKKSLCIHGDFDADGMVATMIMKSGLEALGIPCTTFLPDRTMGHGISLESVESVHARGCEVVVTVDCGVSAVAAVRRAHELGIEVMITDHHLPDSELPPAQMIVNPQLQDDETYKIYSGSGIAFKLLLALAQRFPAPKLKTPEFSSFVRHGIVMAALATVADVVPLRGHNRELVRQALGLFETVDWPGLKQLFKASGIGAQSTAEDLAFQVIPRLNAAQRYEKGELVWELFNARNDTDASELCDRLTQINNERKKHQAEMTQMALGRLEREYASASPPPAIILTGDEWLPGISGLIASRLMEKYHRPAVVICIKEGMGLASCRSPEGYHLKAALDECAVMLIGYGGHRLAAGFRLEPGNIETFKQHFGAIIGRQYEEFRKSNALSPKLLITDELFWSELDDTFLEELQKLEPHGHDNPRPLFACRGVHIEGQPTYMGAGAEHVSLNLATPGRQTMRAVGFNMAKEIKDLKGSRRIDIVFHFVKDRYRRRPQLLLKAVRPVAPTQSLVG